MRRATLEDAAILAGHRNDMFNTGPSHRGRGLAHRIMDAIHRFSAAAGLSSAALNASRSGLPLYESLGFVRPRAR